MLTDTVTAPAAAPVVIYIAGSGRSGSTLVERAVGGIPGFVNVGELIDLFRRVVPRGERCGCGLPFHDCPFWTGVGERAFGGWDNDQPTAVRDLQAQVARQRYFPRLLATPLASQGFRDSLASYGASYLSLYRAIAAEAGAGYVVDASKWPVQALALSRAGLDVRIIHLIRDVRGVAYSLSKQNVARPHVVAGTADMLHHAPARSALRWVACQSQADLLPRAGLRYTRVSYEDFVRDPRRAVRDALHGLGVPVPESQLAHLGQGRLTLGPSHGLSGNPSRFTEGEIALRPDEAWREQMSRRDRVVVTAIALPSLASRRRRQAVRAAASDRSPMNQVNLNGTATAPQPADWPLVSVIMPTRGRPELVRESIAGVVNQTYPGEIECIVVHDQEPADESLVSLSRDRRRIRVTTNTHTQGLAGSRNAGLALANGDFIAGCDDDDVWHPDKLELQVRRLLAEPDLLALGSGLRMRLPGGKVQDWPGRGELISYEFLLRNRVKELHSSTMVMRRETFDKIGPYDEGLPFSHAEDYDWVLRAARAGKVGTIRQPLADIRKDVVNMRDRWHGGGARNVALGLEYVLAKHPDIAASRRGHARILGRIAYARSRLGDRRTALRYAVKGLTRWPFSPHPYIALTHIVTQADPRHILRAARFFHRGI